VARLTTRHAGRSAALWGAVFGIYVISSAFGYASSYPTAAARHALARTFGADVAIDSIIGPAHRIDTVAGFVAWRSLGVLSILGAVWGLLTATRLLRGEEDAGHWELLLAGQTTGRRAAIQAVTGLFVGVVVLWLLTAICTVAAGRSPKVGIPFGPACFLATAVCVGALVFAAVGALSSQLASSRRQAATWAGVGLGVSYALRMVADAGAGLGWLRWITPLGWVEELRPLSSPRPLLLIPLFGLAAAVTSLAVAVAGRRDLGVGVVEARTRRHPRLALLGGPTGLATRLALPVVVAWLASIALTGLMLGNVAKSAGKALTGTPALHRWFTFMGSHGGAEAYLGVGSIVLAGLVALLGSGQMTAMRTEEAEGRLDALLVRPVSSTSWFLGRVGVAVSAVMAAGLVGGVTIWAGAATVGAGVGLPELALAGVNLIPPALVIAGLGALSMGWAPRRVSAVVYGVLAWSFLVELLGGVIRANHWILDTSVFHQMAAAPAVPVDWTSDGYMTGLAMVCGALGLVGFRRRDLTGS